jgi:TolB-like protein
MLALTVCVMLVQAPDAPRAQGKAAVIDFVAAGVDVKLAETVTRLFTAELGRGQGLEVLGRDEVGAVLGFERQRQLLGCADNTCLLEAGSMLDARWLVSGTVGKLGNTLVVSAQIIDTAKGRVQNRSVVRAPSADALAQQVPVLARALLAEPASLHLYNQVPGAMVFVADRFVGKMPLEPLPLSLNGPQQVRAESADHAPWVTEVVLEPGRTTRVRVELDRLDELESKSRWRKIWAGVLCGLAGLSAAGAAAMFVNASAWYRRYDAMDPLDHSQAQLDAVAAEVRGRFGAGYAIAGVSLVAVAAAVWLFVFDPHAEKLKGAGR